MRASNPIEEKIIALIEPAAHDLGLRIVRVRLMGQRRKTLQIMAERLADGLMSVENCEALSRAVSAQFDIVDPIKEEYNLEVSSPGIDRPLMSLEDFVRFTGYEAKLETAQMLDGRKRFKGRLAGVEEGRIRIVLPEGERAVPFAALSEARLVLTDQLIAEALKRQEAGEEEAAPPEPAPAPKKLKLKQRKDP